MNNYVCAPQAGQIAAILVKVDDAVEEGQPLLLFLGLFHDTRLYQLFASDGILPCDLENGGHVAGSAGVALLSGL